MKKFIIYITFLIFAFTGSSKAQDVSQLAAQCAANAGDVMYLKDFIVNLDAGVPGGQPPSARFALLLSKGIVYRFTVCTAPNSDGEAVLQLYNQNTMLGSTYNSETGTEYSRIDFKCQTTGVYHVFISFKDGKAGEGVGIMSYVKKL